MKIVFIEDESQDFDTYSTWMKDAGYDVTVWNESESLREQLKVTSNHKQIFINWFKEIDNRENIVAFVLDINLNIRECDGLSILKMIRNDLFVINQNADYDKIPIIILTSNKEKDDEAHSTPYESPDRFIVKEETNKDSFLNKLNFEIKKHDLKITSKKIYDIVKDTNNKVTELGVLSKIIAKTLPELTDKKKANKIIEEWKKDEEFKKIISECFPEKQKGLFKKLEKFIEKVKDDTAENLSEALYEQAVEYFEKEAEIDSVNDTRMVQFLKYSVYIVEKIGQAVK